MRYPRADAPTASRRSTRSWRRPSAATPDWVNFPATRRSFLDLNPASGARRDSAGSRVGIIAAGNFPGTTGAHPYTGTPATVEGRLLPGHPGPDRPARRTPRPRRPRSTRPRRRRATPTPRRSRSASRLPTPAHAAGVDTTEYRITNNGTAGNWTTFTNTAGASPFVNSVTVPDTGTYLVEYRSTDKAANTEATKSVTFKIQLPVCDRSDEFDGNDDPARAGCGTPATAARPPRARWRRRCRAASCTCRRTTSRSTRPPRRRRSARSTSSPRTCPRWAPTGAWRRSSPSSYTGGWQNVGLVVWNGDNNFFRSTLTHSLSGWRSYVESSKDNPTDDRGRSAHGGRRRTILPTHRSPVTIKMRYRRVNGANRSRRTTRSSRRPTWPTPTGSRSRPSATFLDLNPTAARAVTPPARGSA